MTKVTNKFTKLLSRRLRETVILFFACLSAAYFLPSCASTIEEKPPSEKAYQPQTPEPEKKSDEMKDVDFTNFTHKGEHANVPCLVCHERTDDSPKPKFASHQTCAGCHSEQFKNNSHPICATCHTDNNSGEMKSFPPLKTFNIQFNHAAHFKETNCATCHQTNGAGMTIPAGANAHSNCFQCHTTDKVVAEKNIGSCSTCHQQGSPNRIDASVTNAGYNFSHSAHSRLNCQSCHGQTSGNKMSAIKVGMHSNEANSCATCHNGGKAFGARNFNDCSRCHTEVPASRSIGIKFSHAEHAKSSCATCHKQGGKGVNFTVPNGEAAHNTCFQCHSPMKGGGNFTTSKCFQCHQIGGGDNIQPSPVTIAGNFSHSKHKALNCSSCHNSSKGNMSAPTVAMHKASKSGFNCASCHDNQKAFGEDFNNCKRCHTSGKFKM